ncbi:MAG: MASE3 domain-containing protein [Methanoregula sp.]|nr:MASE3 domain-containing protein [Methanoregula sp.]
MFTPVNLLNAAIVAIILMVLYLISLQNYILFHGIVELAGIAVAFSIFIIVWNTRRDIKDTFFLIVGISFLFIGSIDLIHTLAYKGMGVFPGNNADLPTQLWIAARYFQSITFLIATLFIGRTITRDRKYDAAIIIAACTAACTLLFMSLFVWQNFPPCFIEGSGLTPFKIASEYIISLILIVTISILYHKREHFDPTVWKYLIAAQVFLILGELAFTSYISVYGFMNLLGHLFRLISVYLFYRAFVVISLTRPYDLLLRELRQEELHIQESEKKYRTLFENMMEGFAYCRMIYNDRGEPVDWEYLVVNKAFGHLTGLENITGKRVVEVIPDIRTLNPELFETYGRVASTGKPETFEIDFKPLNMWLKISVSSPEKGFFVAVFEDVTEQKTAEIALKKSNEELDQFFAVALDLLCIADTEGNFHKLNKSWETTLGYPIDELKAHRFLDFVHPDDLQATLAVLNSLSNQQEVIGFENRYRCSDGTYRWLEWRSFPYGNLIYAAARDITQRRQVEDEMRKARDFYLKILDDFPNPIWRADVNATCDYFNRDWLMFTGRTLEQELGDGWVAGVHPDDLDRCLKIYLDHFHTRQPFEMEYRLRYHDGTYHWLYDSGKPFYTPDGVFAGFIGSCYDIQDRKLAEDALRLVNNKLNLLSSITRHDIRNQLMALNAYIALSEEALGNPVELKEFIVKEQKIADSIARQIAFTKDYEDLGVKSPVWQNVSMLVRDAGTALPMLNIGLDIQCPGLEVFADPLIEKVFYNLIENSLHYGGEKMTVIRVTVHESNEQLRIIYDDDGSGISAYDKKELFTKGFGKHTGLGLYLSREILSITGITITENGEPGNGVRFEITVPKGVYRFTDR